MLLYVLVCLVVRYVSGTNVFEDVAEGSRPFQVSLKLHDAVHDEDNHFCSGAILNPKWVVTVARCLDNKRSHKIWVVAGTIKLGYYGSWYEVGKTIMHEKYDRINVANDVGLLKIKDKIVFNDKVSAISLPAINIPPGSICIVSGWGYSDGNGHFSTNLQETNVTTISTEECRNTKLKKYFTIRPITDKQICAYKLGGGEICMGEKGALLTKDGELVGLASYEVPCTVGLPNVYLRVYEHKAWITKHMK